MPATPHFTADRRPSFVPAAALVPGTEVDFEIPEGLAVVLNREAAGAPVGTHPVVRVQIMATKAGAYVTYTVAVDKTREASFIPTISMTDPSGNSLFDVDTARSAEGDGFYGVTWRNDPKDAGNPEKWVDLDTVTVLDEGEVSKVYAAFQKRVAAAAKRASKAPAEAPAAVRRTRRAKAAEAPADQPSAEAVTEAEERAAKAPAAAKAINRRARAKTAAPVVEKVIEETTVPAPKKGTPPTAPRRRKPAAA